jgi:hypothetical protein
MTISFLLLLFDGSKNGQVVGTVYKEMQGPLYPTVAVHSQNEEYVVPLYYFFVYWIGCMLIYSSSLFILQIYSQISMLSVYCKAIYQI